MFWQILWWAANFLQAALLYRCIRGKYWTRFRLFYFYLSAVLVRELISYYLFVFHPGLRGTFYWHTEVLLDLLAYLVIWEITQLAFQYYPGVGRLAQTLVAWAFVLVAVRLVIVAGTSDHGSIATTSAELARNLRIVQAAFLIVIVGVVAYYGIPLGRSLKSILGGYAFYVGVSVIDMTVQFELWERFRIWWVHAEQLAYVGSLTIWCYGLWSYHPNPVPVLSSLPEEDYRVLADRTARALKQARNYIIGALRS